ncbi:MAG: amino acid adenylation domain-containing protein [Gammaproteobacteria bacterium]|jgi:amino acid adenylation domain-containing protein/FkbH-like protein
MIVVISTFTDTLLKKPLKLFLSKFSSKTPEIVFAPYNQVFQQLSNETSLCSKNTSDPNVILIRFEDWIDEDDKEQLSNLQEDVQFFWELLQKASTKTTHPWIVCVCPDSPRSLKVPGRKEVYNKLLTQFHNHCDKTSNVYFIDPKTIQSFYPVKDYYDAKSDEIGKIPYVDKFFYGLAAIIVRRINVIGLPPYKAIIVDCDNTLWKGVCGEVGYSGIKISEPYKQFQKFLVQQKKDGMLICLCSKNSYKDVHDVFVKRRNDMPLKWEHITTYKINWEKKTSNISEIATQLNIGLDSFIFIDDNPVECGMVRETLQDVLTLQVPVNINNFPLFLKHVWPFDHLKVTQEDKKRTEMYKQNLQRKNEEKSINAKSSSTSSSSVSKFLKRLKLVVTTKLININSKHIARVAQLTQRTNQFNFTTQRFSEKKIQNAISNGQYCMAVWVKDRFGNHGLVGVVIFSTTKKSLQVNTFLLSCRVLAKNVEHHIIVELAKFALKQNILQIEIAYKRTEKNIPAFNFLHRMKVATKLSPDNDNCTFIIKTEDAKNINLLRQQNNLLSREKVKKLSSKRTRPYNLQYIEIATKLATVEQISNAMRPKILTKKTPIQFKTEFERQIVNIIEDILCIKGIAPNDNFIDIGFSSLYMVLAISKIKNKYEVTVKLEELFKISNAKQLVNLVSQRFVKTRKNLPKKQKLMRIQERYKALPLSDAQQRLWVSFQTEQNKSLYNMIVSYKLVGTLNLEALKKAFQTLIMRHESLRTKFISKENNPNQIVLPYSAKLFYLTQRPLDSTLSKKVDIISQKPFDLSDAPLMRVTLFSNQKDEHLLSIVWHHIINDGWSFNLLMKELSTLYNYYVEQKREFGILTTFMLINKHIQNSLLNNNKNIDEHLWSLNKVYAETFKLVLSYLVSSNNQQRYISNWKNQLTLSSQKINNTIPGLSVQKIDYIDFSVWHRQYVRQKKIFDDSLRFWNAKLTDCEAINFPTDYPVSKISSKSYKALRKPFTIEKNVLSQLKELAKAKNTTLYNVLLTLFFILLARYSNQKKLIIHVPNAGRNHQDTQNMVGFFVNLIPVVVDLQENSTFYTIIEKLIKFSSESLKHQELPFNELVKSLHFAKYAKNNPLLRIAFVYQNFPVHKLNLNGLNVSRIFTDNNDMLVDNPLYSKNSFFTLYMQENSKIGTCQALLEYNTALFEESTINRVITHFKMLMQSIIDNPKCNIFKLPMLTEEEIRNELEVWNNTKTEFSKNQTITQLFEQQVQKTPKKIAVSFYNVKMSYEMLNVRSNQLSHYLRQECGVITGSFVAICMNSNPQRVISIMGAIKTGAAYIPLDPLYPKSRIEFILNDSGAKVCLVNKVTLKLVAQIKTNCKFIAIEDIVFKKYKTVNPLLKAKPQDLAYLLYTSGTTGKPKGVLIEHRSIVNTIFSQFKKFDINQDSRILQFASFTFDASVSEIFTALLSGATLCLIREKDRLNRLIEFMNDAKITVATLPPMLLKTIDVSKVKSLKTLVTAGEPIDNETTSKYKSIPVFCNAYGPTECTIHVTNNRFKKGKKFGIGQPIDNTKCYVLNKYMQLVPVGVIDKLYVGGKGVGRGYHNRPELTKEKFINVNIHGKKLRLFDTGDLVYRLSDGNLVFVRRIADDYIKINAFRIHPGEVTSALYKTKVARQIVVDKVGKQLVAYVVPEYGYLCSSLHKYYEKHVRMWRNFYDNVTHKDLSVSNVNDTSGWINSYTEKPFSKNEMSEWVETTVNRIQKLPTSHGKILEIGCGTGLLLFPLVKQCKQYIATDFSEKVIDPLKKKLKKHGIKNTVLKQKSAHQFEKENESYDLIVINSVAQYFPDIRYLIKVLEDAVNNISSSGGSIFIGDVRSLAHLRLFYASLFLSKNPNISVKECKQFIINKFHSEKELVISHEFFKDFAASHPKISVIELQLRRGNYNTEMNCFRYDVILHVNNLSKKLLFSRDVEWVDYKIKQVDIVEISNQLKSKPKYLALKNIPNARLINTVNCLQTLFGSKNKSTLKSVNPETLWKLEELFPEYKVNITWSKQYPYNCMDVVIYKRNSYLYANFIPGIHMLSPSKMNNYATHPLKVSMKQQLISEMRLVLKETLPFYMHPSKFIFLDNIPLTINGKTDKKVLQLYNTVNPLHIKFEKPSSETQKIITNIFTRLLGIDSIGVNENFDNYGADSLTIMRLVATINEKFNLNIGYTDILLHLTVKKLSVLIEHLLLAKAKVLDVPKYFVTIQDKGRNTPLFLVHDIYGTVFQYQFSPKVLKNRPIYAIQHPGIGNKELQFKTMQNMAEAYMNLIISQSPKEPYFIGGYSFGGLVALEIAKMLEYRGAQHICLFLFDTWIIPKDKHDVFINIELNVKQFLEKHNNDVENLGIDKIANRQLQMAKIFLAPKLKKTHIVLFKAEQPTKYSSKIECTDNNLQQCTKQKITVCKVPGTHELILDKKNISKFTLLLNSEIEKQEQWKVYKKPTTAMFTDIKPRDNLIMNKSNHEKLKNSIEM